MTLARALVTCPTHNGETNFGNEHFPEYILARYTEEDGGCPVCLKDRADNIVTQGLLRAWEILNQWPRWKAQKQTTKAAKRLWKIIGSTLNEIGSPGGEDDWFEDDNEHMGFDIPEPLTLQSMLGYGYRQEIHFKPLLTDDLSEKEKADSLKHWNERNKSAEPTK